MSRYNRGPIDEPDDVDVPVYGDSYTYAGEEEKAVHNLSKKGGGLSDIALPIGGLRANAVVTSAGGESWKGLVKRIQQEHGISYKEAMKQASSIYRGMKSQSQSQSPPKRTIQDKVYGSGEVSENKNNDWISFVKSTRNELGCSYKEALSEASIRWRQRGNLSK